MRKKLPYALFAAFFVLAAVGLYILGYYNGLRAPNASTRSVLQNGLTEVDRLTAEKAQADLDKLFQRIKSGGEFKSEELTEAIRAVAKYAGNVEELYQEAQHLSKGKYTPPSKTSGGKSDLPTGPTNSSAPSSSPDGASLRQAPAEVTLAPPSDPYAQFWAANKVIEVDSSGRTSWERFYSGKEPPAYALPTPACPKEKPDDESSGQRENLITRQCFGVIDAFGQFWRPSPACSG